MKPRTDWVVLGPEPHLATCQRCGTVVPMPQLPLEISRFVRLIRSIERKHRDCLEPRR